MRPVSRKIFRMRWEALGIGLRCLPSIWPLNRPRMILRGGGASIYHNQRGGKAMKTGTFGAFVIASACLFATGTAFAQSGSGGGSAGSGSAGSGTSGMTSQGLGSEPAGIGERGTGQTQSTLERSGASGQKGMTSEPAGIGEKGTGQTQSTMERSGLGQSGTAQSGSPLPSGVGEQGTGQTQGTMERSGGKSSSSQSAMDRPER